MRRKSALGSQAEAQWISRSRRKDPEPHHLAGATGRSAAKQRSTTATPNGWKLLTIGRIGPFRKAGSPTSRPLQDPRRPQFWSRPLRALDEAAPACTSGRRSQASDLIDRCDTSRCGLGALFDELVIEELLVLVLLMKVVRRQDGRYDRHFGVQLNAHQPADDGVSDELVPVNAAIDDEPGGYDGGIAPALGEQQRACSGISNDPGTSKKSMSPSPNPCLAISAVNDTRH